MLLVSLIFFVMISKPVSLALSYPLYLQYLLLQVQYMTCFMSHVIYWTGPPKGLEYYSVHREPQPVDHQKPLHITWPTIFLTPPPQCFWWGFSIHMLARLELAWLSKSAQRGWDLKAVVVIFMIFFVCLFLPNPRTHYPNCFAFPCFFLAFTFQCLVILF